MTLVVRSASGGKYIHGLLRSLHEATLTELEYNGRYSRSGASFYLDSFKAKYWTNKHVHEIDCKKIRQGIPVEGEEGTWEISLSYMCEWDVDGEYQGVLELEIGNDILKEVKDVLSAALRIEKTEDNRILLSNRPAVYMFDTYTGYVVP